MSKKVSSKQPEELITTSGEEVTLTQGDLVWFNRNPLLVELSSPRSDFCGDNRLIIAEFIITVTETVAYKSLSKIEDDFQKKMQGEWETEVKEALSTSIEKDDKEKKNKVNKLFNDMPNDRKQLLLNSYMLNRVGELGIDLEKESKIKINKLIVPKSLLRDHITTQHIISGSKYVTFK